MISKFLVCTSVHNIFLRKEIYQNSESIDSIGFNGGSGWTRTTDLTLISSATYLRNTIKSMLSEVWYARGYAQILLFLELVLDNFVHT